MGKRGLRYRLSGKSRSRSSFAKPVLDRVRLIDRKHEIPRNVSLARGDSFFAAGWGKWGPYAVATHRVAHRTYLKGTVGSRGITGGVKHSGREYNASLGYNFASGRPYASLQKKKKR